jgi:hypothetical protein
MKFLKRGLIIFLIMLVPTVALAAPVTKNGYDIPDYMTTVPGSDGFDLIGFVKTLIN